MSYKKVVPIDKPICLTVSFLSEINHFTVLNKSGKIFYLRKFNNPTNCASFNINEQGSYTVISDAPVNGLKTSKIKRHIPIPMPTKNWDYTGATTKQLSTKSNSPASIFPSKRHMLINPKMGTYPICVANFIIAHEKGHQLYASEMGADLYAINYVMAKGGNLYPCLYTLSTVLTRSPLKMMRIESMIKHIKKSNYYGGK